MDRQLKFESAFLLFELLGPLQRVQIALQQDLSCDLIDHFLALLSILPGQMQRSLRFNGGQPLIPQKYLYGNKLCPKFACKRLSLRGGRAQTPVHIFRQSNDDPANSLLFNYPANFREQPTIRLQRPVRMSEALEFVGDSNANPLISTVNTEQAHTLLKRLRNERYQAFDLLHVVTIAH